jgi:hypothetical protein
LLTADDAVYLAFSQLQVQSAASIQLALWLSPSRHAAVTAPNDTRPMKNELPIEPAADSPVFRASLTALDAKASAIRKTCKNALQAAQAVHELLEKLEAAESELFDTLDSLKRHIVQVDTKGTAGQDGSGLADDVVRDLKAWKMNERAEERQRLDTLVTSRVRALRADMKLKGVGGGGTLSSFEVCQAALLRPAALKLL